MRYEKGMIAVNSDTEYCATYSSPLEEWRLCSVPWTCCLFGGKFWNIIDTTNIEQVAAQWIEKYGMTILDEMPTIMELRKEQAI